MNRRRPNLSFYEFGNCYRLDRERKQQVQEGLSYEDLKSDPSKVLAGYSEDQHLGLWLTGKRVEGSWAHADEEATVFELKAHVVNILRRLGIPMGAFLWQASQNDIFAKGLALCDRQGKVFAEFGLVAKAITGKMDLSQDVYFADIHWTRLMKKVPQKTVNFKELAKFPAVKRDLALLLDKGVEFEQVRQLAEKCDKKLLKSVELFDVYEGKNLPAGKKSYAVSFILQDETKTMSDKAIDAIMQKIITTMQKQLGAELR